MKPEAPQQSGGGRETPVHPIRTLWARPPRLGMAIAWTGLLFGLLLAPLTPAQTNNRTPGPDVGVVSPLLAPATSSLASLGRSGDRVSQLQAKLADAQAELSLVLASSGQSTNLPPGATAGEAIDYRSALQRLVRTCQLHLDDLAAVEVSHQRQEELRRTIKAWSGFDEPPPYSVLFVDNLRDSIQSLNERIKAAEAASALVEQFLADSRAALRESEEKLRRLDEQAESAKDVGVITRLTWQRKLEQARQRGAAAAAASFETKRQLASAEMAEARQRLAFAQRQLAVAARQVRFSQDDLDRVLNDLATEQLQLEREVQDAESDLDTRQKACDDARESLRQALQGEVTDTPRLRASQETLGARELERQTAVQRLSVLRQLLEGVGTERQIWQKRFAVTQSRNLAELQTASQQLARLHDLVESARRYYRQQIELAANQVSEEEKRLRTQAAAASEAALTRQRIESYEQREGIYRRALQGLERRGLALTRWREALDYNRGTLPLTDRVRDLAAEASTFVSKLWNLELFVVEDTITVDGQAITGQRGVTLGKIFTAILILGVGYWLSDFASGMLEKVARKRLKVEANQANLIRRWVRVVLVLGLIVFSLVSVKIPLTVFAFAGGALAIGVGFGTQNLLKNFISGIVILFERPFRVGDVLAVGSHTGLVTSIGIRSSIIQLWDGTETLIPNSALLENNLTNWTYSNRAVRFAVSVGLAYGSDTRRAAQLLAEVAHRHGQVEKEPKPQVYFTEFGDSALTFELRYWVDILKHNAAQIASDLRHMINGAFSEEGIVIAFPQRDVRLKAERPIAVQVVSHYAGIAAPGPATDPVDNAAPAASGAVTLTEPGTPTERRG